MQQEGRRQLTGPVGGIGVEQLSTVDLNSATSLMDLPKLLVQRNTFGLRAFVELPTRTESSNPNRTVADIFWSITAATQSLVKGSGCQYTAVFRRAVQLAPCSKGGCNVRQHKSTVVGVCLDNEFQQVEDAIIGPAGEDPRAFEQSGQPWALTVMSRRALKPQERQSRPTEQLNDFEVRLWRVSPSQSTGDKGSKGGPPFVALRAPWLRFYGKNWVGVSDPLGLMGAKAELRVVIAVAPLTIARCSAHSGMCTKEINGFSSGSANVEVGELRCGSNGLVVAADGSFLMLARQSRFVGGQLTHIPRLLLVNGSTHAIRDWALAPATTKRWPMISDPMSIFPCVRADGEAQRSTLCASLHHNEHTTKKVLFRKCKECSLANRVYELMI